jgi:hypothetical protein
MLIILNNVIVNRVISLKCVRVELFPLPPNLLRYDFKQWIDDYRASRDEEYVAWVKKNNAMSNVASSSKYSYLLYFVLLFHYGGVPFP